MDVESYLAICKLGGWLCVHCYLPAIEGYRFHCNSCLSDHHNSRNGLNNGPCSIERETREALHESIPH